MKMRLSEECIFILMYMKDMSSIFFQAQKFLVLNPLSPSIHIQILQTDLHTFP